MKIYKSGTIVVANYVTFKGETKRGIFMIMYDESFDNNVSNCMNVIAIKITTQLDMVSGYVINLKNEENTFFKSDCLASCSKIHTLHKNQIVKTIGFLGEKTYSKVYSKMRHVFNEIDRQMTEGLL